MPVGIQQSFLKLKSEQQKHKTTMPAPHFFKFTFNDSSAHVVGSAYQYREGLNTEAKWSPEMAEGGFSFTTLRHATKWANKCNYVWDVTIPEDEHRISMVAKGKCKAASIIMSHKRPVKDLLTPYPVAVQVRIYQAYPELMTLLGVKPTYEMVAAFAPHVVRTQGDITYYDNGLIVSRSREVLSDGDMRDVFTGVFTRNCSYIAIRPDVGSVFKCYEFRDGHAYGPGIWIRSDGIMGESTFLHTVFTGPGINNLVRGTYHLGEFTAIPEDPKEMPKEMPKEEQKEMP